MLENLVEILEAATAREAEKAAPRADLLVVDLILPDSDDTFSHVHRLAKFGKPLCVFSDLPEMRVAPLKVQPVFQKTPEGHRKLLAWIKEQTESAEIS